MSPEAKEEALILDIRKAALELQSFVAGMDEATFHADLKTQKAVEREFEIIGEASRGIGSATREKFPKVPFRKMIGMRNILAHDYGRVDTAEVWRVIQEDLPNLLIELKR